MATYIELHWAGQTRAELQRSFLETAIHRRNENYILRKIFPPTYWSDTAQQYDFVANEGNIWQLLKQYLKNAETGGMMGGNEEWARRADRLIGFVENQFEGYSFEQPSVGSSDMVHSKEWAKRVWEFIQRGKKIQLAGLNPKISISY